MRCPLLDQRPAEPFRSDSAGLGIRASAARREEHRRRMSYAVVASDGRSRRYRGLAQSSPRAAIDTGSPRPITR